MFHRPAYHPPLESIIQQLKQTITQEQTHLHQQHGSSYLSFPTDLSIQPFVDAVRVQSCCDLLYSGVSADETRAMLVTPQSANAQFHLQTSARLRPPPPAPPSIPPAVACTIPTPEMVTPMNAPTMKQPNTPTATTPGSRSLAPTSSVSPTDQQQPPLSSNAPFNPMKRSRDHTPSPAPPQLQSQQPYQGGSIVKPTPNISANLLSTANRQSPYDRDSRGGGDDRRDQRERRVSAYQEEYEGDDRALPRTKKPRTESPSPPPPPTNPNGAAAVAGSANPFISGNAKLLEDEAKKWGSRATAEANIKRQREEAASAAAQASISAPTKSLGGKGRAKFTPPYRKQPGEEKDDVSATVSGAVTPMLQKALAGPGGKEGEVHEKLRGLDTKLIEMIMNEMFDHSPGVGWSDIAGLEFAKKSVREIVVWPLLKPELFTGLRGPPKGLLLFGPPGTGKTLIGKAIASESKSRFFSISASSLTSKWSDCVSLTNTHSSVAFRDSVGSPGLSVSLLLLSRHGEGEKLVRTLFAVAQVHEPSIIFIDEIDSLLSQRQESEFEASRRIKTEFLVQLDGASTTGKERVLVVGATNRPQELDEAARRRLVKKLYIPLPDSVSRMSLLRLQMKTKGTEHCMSEQDFETIVKRSEGYSGSDLTHLCTEAAYGPIREVSSLMDVDDLSNVSLDAVRPIELKDFDVAFQSIRPSVNQKDLAAYEAWNNQYGSFPMPTNSTPATANQQQD